MAMIALLCVLLAAVHTSALEETAASDAWVLDSVPDPFRTYTTMHRGPSNIYRIYHGLWVHNRKFVAVVPDPGASGVSRGLSVNQQMIQLPARDGGAFVNNLRTKWIPGNTLAIDFPFPAFPTNLGHWAEVVLPAYSTLSQLNWANDTLSTGVKRPVIDNVLLVNLFERELGAWFRETLELALAAVRPADAPPLRVMDTSALTAGDPLNWLGFENYIVITDRYTHETGLSGYLAGDHGDWWKAPGCERFIQSRWLFGFHTPGDGAAFRAAAYERIGAPPPPPDAAVADVPRTITFLTAATGELIVNRYEVLAMLWEVAAAAGWRVRPFTITNEAPFSAHVAAAARTGLLVARHGPALASAIFLPPGAAVYELLPFNWEWRHISQLYRNMTASVGDVHHFAWRPREPRWATYLSPDDARYSSWTAEECTARGCMTAHVRAGLRVDVETVRADVTELLRGMTARDDGCADAACRVQRMRRLWPEAS